MTTENKPQEGIVAEDELSLKEIKQFLSIFKGLWKKVLLFLAVPIIVFALIGFIASATSPKEYDAKCVLITDQVASSGSGSLQGLASLAGIPVPGAAGGGGESLGADLYPLVISNKPFLIELSKQVVYDEELKRKMTLEQFFRRTIKTDLIKRITQSILHPSTIGNLFKKEVNQDPSIFTAAADVKDKDSVISNQFFSNLAYVSELTDENKKMIVVLSERIKFSQSGKLITLSVKMPQAKLSAEVAKIVLNQLIKYVTKFKTGKQLENLAFLEERTAESEIKYKASQQRLAGFKDNNYHVIYESVQSREQQLQNEFTLAFSLYNQFVTQLEQARIQLKKETPLFTVVEPVYIPEAISADSNKLIISYASSGFMIGLLLVFYLLGKTFIQSFKKNK